MPSIRVGVEEGGIVVGGSSWVVADEGGGSCARTYAPTGGGLASTDRAWPSSAVCTSLPDGARAATLLPPCTAPLGSAASVARIVAAGGTATTPGDIRPRTCPLKRPRPPTQPPKQARLTHGPVRQRRGRWRARRGAGACIPRHAQQLHRDDEGQGTPVVVGPGDAAVADCGRHDAPQDSDPQRPAEQPGENLQGETYAAAGRAGWPLHAVRHWRAAFLWCPIRPRRPAPLWMVQAKGPPTGQHRGRRRLSTGVTPPRWAGARPVPNAAGGWLRALPAPAGRRRASPGG